MFGMGQQRNQPIYWERKGSLFSFTLIFPLVVVIIGVMTGQPLLVIVGAGIATFNWFTSPKEYQIYRDALIIVYGRPRVRVVHFGNISRFSVLTLPWGSDRLLVELVTGRRLVLQIRDSQAFHDRLQEALDSFRQTHPQVELPDEGPQDPEPP